jgi:ribosomal protein S18 acetylase RimI-like enzyme
MMPVILRPITTSETESIVAMLRDAEEGEERIRAAVLNAANTSYGAFDGETLVGAATLHWEQHESEIIYMAVADQLRGRGYGKAMIEALFDEMRQRGVSALLVGTANSSLENIAFYQKCGFRLHSVRQNYFDYIQPPITEHGIPVRDMLVMRYAERFKFARE